MKRASQHKITKPILKARNRRALGCEEKMNKTQTAAQAANQNDLLRDFEDSLQTITGKAGGDKTIAARKTLISLGRHFDGASIQPAAEKLAAVLPTITDYTSRYTTLTLLGDIGQKNAASAKTVAEGLANYIGTEKDGGLVYMTGQKLAAIASAFPETAVTAAQAVADALTSEKDDYARRSLSFSMASIGHISADARAIAIEALGKTLTGEKDIVARCLTSGTLSDFGMMSQSSAEKTLHIYAQALDKELSPQVMNHITQDIAAVAKAQPATLPAAINALVNVINDKNGNIKQPEKIFAASHALRLLGDQAPAPVATAVADALTGNTLPETQRRVYILTLDALAKTDTTAAQTAHAALTQTLGSEPSSLNRRHSIHGMMSAVKNGADGKETAAKLFKHLDSERDRETRELVNRSLMTLGHPLPKVKPLIPQPKV